nr:anaerobic sulfatase-maturation protein [Candidatus Sigynarchaeota archaeon]
MKLPKEGKPPTCITPWPPAGFHVMIKPRGSVCNLNCRYCFYLPKKELYPGSTFRMSDVVLEKFTREYIRSQKVPEVTFGWQGGEPLLMGLDFFKKAVALQNKYTKPGMRVNNALQTNGTLIDDEWATFFHDNNFLIGISIDGPPELHDVYRIDAGGGGSFVRVKKGLDTLKKHKVEYNILACVNNVTAGHPLEVYRYFRDDLQASFIQFIPIVEAVPTGDTGLTSNASERSVSGDDYGAFLIAIFDEWVRRDVGNMFVQLFDVSLGAWMGQPGGLCVYAKTCGNALALEHNGDLYACDHFVVPNEKRGNIMDNQLINLVAKNEQMRFGASKWTMLPMQCVKCEWRFACNGECPKNRLDRAKDGEPGLNHLCAGLYAFFKHVDPYMKFMANELRNQRPAANIMAFLKVHTVEDLERYRS